MFATTHPIATAADEVVHAALDANNRARFGDDFTPTPAPTGTLADYSAAPQDVAVMRAVVEATLDAYGQDLNIGTQDHTRSEREKAIWLQGDTAGYQAHKRFIGNRGEQATKVAAVWGQDFTSDPRMAKVREGLRALWPDLANHLDALAEAARDPREFRV